jgi:hypothetical protein
MGHKPMVTMLGACSPLQESGSVPLRSEPTERRARKAQYASVDHPGGQREQPHKQHHPNSVALSAAMSTRSRHNASTLLRRLFLCAAASLRKVILRLRSGRCGLDHSAQWPRIAQLGAPPRTAQAGPQSSSSATSRRRRRSAWRCRSQCCCAPMRSSSDRDWLDSVTHQASTASNRCRTVSETGRIVSGTIPISGARIWH